MSSYNINMELNKIKISIGLMMALFRFTVSAVSMNDYFRYENLISRNPPGLMPAFGNKFEDLKLESNCYISVDRKRIMAAIGPAKPSSPKWMSLRASMLRLFSNRISDAVTNTVEDCILYCWLKTKPIAMLHKGNKCHCESGKIKKVNSNQCKIRCKANLKQNCGGENAFATYKTGYAYYPHEGITTPGVNYDSSKFYMGCYEDPTRLDERLDFGTLRMTVDLCCASCFNLYHHNFAAVHNGAFCICFPKVYTLNKLKDFLCQKVKCVNNEKQFCGGEYSEIRVFKRDSPPRSGASITRLRPYSTYLKPYIRPEGCYDYFDGAKDRVDTDEKCNLMPLPDDQNQQPTYKKIRSIGGDPDGAGQKGGARKRQKGNIALGRKLTSINDDGDSKKKSDLTFYAVSFGVLGALLIGFFCFRKTQKENIKQLEKEEIDKKVRKEKKRKKKEEKRRKRAEEAAKMAEKLQEENYFDDTNVDDDIYY